MSLLKFQPSHSGLLTSALSSMSYNHPIQDLDTFLTDTFSWNPTIAAANIPDDPSDASDPRTIFFGFAVSAIEKYRLKKIESWCGIPNAVIYRQPDAAIGTDKYYTCGLGTYLEKIGENVITIKKFSNHITVRDCIAGLGDGHKLECVAAGLLDSIKCCGIPTQKSGDQGIDVVAKKDFINIQNFCSSGIILDLDNFKKEYVHIIGSCKANEGNTGAGEPKLFEAAHLRELVGSWLIQRSDAGAWKAKTGIKLLTPIQLLLATTYRLSADSWKLANDLGVSVWDIPKIVYLLCKFGPENLFPKTDDYTFNQSNFSEWINNISSTRI